MVAEKLNPTPSNLIDLDNKLHGLLQVPRCKPFNPFLNATDALSQLTLASKDIPPQSPLMSPSPPPPTAATPATFHPLTNVDATDDLSDDDLTEGAITPTEETRGGDALAAGDENSKVKKPIFNFAWEAMVAQGIDVTTATFHPLTHVDAIPLDDTADFDEDESTESTMASTQETWDGDDLMTGDENNKEKKSLFDLAWEAMVAQGIDVTGGKNMTAIVEFLEDNPEWLEEHTISNGEPSILQRGRTLKIEVRMVVLLQMLHTH